MNEQEFLAQKVWAVVGAHHKPDRFGNKLLRRLRALGYETYAVNPRYNEIDEQPSYPDLSSLPVKPDVLNMVVSPERGKAVLEEAARLGIRNIWFQPGTWDADIGRLAQQLGLNTIRSCVLVATSEPAEHQEADEDM